MGIKGKYFVILNKPTGLVLDIKGGSHSPGTPVLMWNRHGGDNQVWYEEPVTGTIRSKLNNLCLDINGSNKLIVNNYQPGDSNQQWHYNKKRKTIENRANPNKVLDIAGENKSAGGEVCMWDHHGRDNQQWKIDPLPVKYFFIKSKLNGKVLDIEGGSKDKGARVIMFQQKGHDSSNQLWFEDCYGNIRSKHNEKLCLDASSGTLHTGEFETGRPRVFWCIQGNKIVNRHDPNEVLDIKEGSHADCAPLCAWKFHGGNNQLWTFEYV